MYIITVVVITTIVIIIIVAQSKKDPHPHPKKESFLPPPYQQPCVGSWSYVEPPTGPFRRLNEYGDAITIPLPMGPQATEPSTSYGQQTWSSAPSGRTRVLLGISPYDGIGYGEPPVVTSAQGSLDLNNARSSRSDASRTWNRAYRNIDYGNPGGVPSTREAGDTHVYNPPNPSYTPSYNPSSGPVPAGSLKEYSDKFNRRFTFDPQWKLIGIFTRFKHENDHDFKDRYDRSEIMNIHRRDISPGQDCWEYLAEDRDGFKIRLRNTRYIEDGDIIKDIPGKPGDWKANIYSENRWIFL